MLHEKIPPVKSNRVGAKLFVRIKLSLIHLFGPEPTKLQAQESLNIKGGNASESGGSVSYSVRQVVNQTHAETNIASPRFGNPIRFVGILVSNEGL